MALIKCPECQNEISDKTSQCIKCGYVLTFEDKVKMGAEIDINEIIAIKLLKDQMSALESIIKYSKDNKLISKAYNLKGLAYQKLKDYTKTEENFLKAIEIDNNEDALNNLATFYEVIQKDYKKAEQYFLKAIDAGSKMALNNYGFFLEYMKKEYDKAEKYYLEAVNNDISLGVYNLASFYANQKNNFEKAIEYYQIALDRGITQAQKDIEICKNMIMPKHTIKFANFTTSVGFNTKTEELVFSDSTGEHKVKISNILGIKIDANFGHYVNKHSGRKEAIKTGAICGLLGVTAIIGPDSFQDIVYENYYYCTRNIWNIRLRNGKTVKYKICPDLGENLVKITEKDIRAIEELKEFIFSLPTSVIRKTYQDKNTIKINFILEEWANNEFFNIDVYTAGDCYVYDSKTNTVLAQGKMGDILIIKSEVPIKIYIKRKGYIGKPSVIANPGDIYEVTGGFVNHLEKVDKLKGDFKIPIHNKI